MKNRKDIQNEFDERKVPINKVGIKDVKYPIIVEDKINKTQNTIADLNIYVNLPHQHRGTHMSRFIEVLNEFHKDNLINKLPEFLIEIKKRLKSESAFIEIKFPYFIDKIAPVSNIKSIMSYDCFFNASYQNSYELIIGIKVPITTLCPCSKEISDYGAHNQRSIVTVEFSYNEFIWMEEIIEIVENQASCEIYSLLKRPDEKYVTEKAYDNPKFVEDIVRDVTLKLKEDKRIKWFRVQSENFESIHNHSAYACVEFSK
jgi:GTP cyclohydrolase I